MTGVQTCALPIFTISIGTLGAGASATVSSAPRVLTTADFDHGSVTNIATDTGTPPSGPNVTASDTDTVPLQQNPSIALDKSHETIVDANHDEIGRASCRERG